MPIPATHHVSPTCMNLLAKVSLLSFLIKELISPTFKHHVLKGILWANFFGGQDHLLQSPHQPTKEFSHSCRGLDSQCHPTAL